MANTSWLQILINNPQGLPCPALRKRSCPGMMAAGEGGIDLPSPPGTPVYALAPGVIIGAGYFWHAGGNSGHGVVTIRVTNGDGSFTDLYYQHIILDPAIQLCNQQGGQLYNGIVGPKPSGQMVQKNQLLGIVSPDGVVEVGMNANWLGIWGDSPHPGPWISDPEPYIRSLIALGGGQGSGTFGTASFTILGNTVSGQTVQQILQEPGFIAPIAALDSLEQWKSFQFYDVAPGQNIPVLGGISDAGFSIASIFVSYAKFIGSNSIAFLIRGIVVLLGVILLLALVINATSYVVQETGTEDAMKTAATAAML